MNIQEEIKDGYFVSEKQKKIWNVQIDLLQKLLVICEKNNIKCYVIWGTLLGCIRHKGFIPWDDDLDVAMSREDYDRLCEIAESEFETPFFFQTARSDLEFFIGYARLRNSSTTGIIKENFSPKYNNGIYIDIYPLDGLIKDGLKRKTQFLMKSFYFYLANAYYNNLKIQNKIKQRIYKGLNLFSHLFTYEEIVKKYEFWCKKYNNEAERIGLVYHENLWKKYNIKKEYVDEIIMMPFEDIKVPVPKKYVQILEEVYGDYMKFPPIEERGQWHGDNLIYDPDISYIEYFNNHNLMD